MIDAFVNRVLPNPPASRGARLFWAAFLLLGPLAYVAGTWLEQRAIARTTAPIGLDRDAAIATGQQFLSTQGLDTTGWGQYASIDASKDLLEYLRIHREPAAEAVQSFVSPVILRVLIMSGDRIAQVFLNREGQPIGYDLTRAELPQKGESLKADDQLAVARASIDRIPNLAATLTLGKPAALAADQAGKGCNKFSWPATADGLPGLKFDVQSAVCGTTVVKQTVTAVVDSAYASAHWGRAGKPLKILLILYGVFITIVVIYSIYRYARRSLEREISHKRTLGIGLVVGGAMMINFLCALDEYAFGLIAAGQTMMWYPLVASLLVFQIGGLGLAVAYGAGEGDLREFYPGKMTSLDALMRGKFFSRNVGRAALFGIACGAWMLVLEGLADLMMRPDTVSFVADLLKLPFLRFPLIAVFAKQATIVTIIPASGLLLPLAYLGRKVQRPRLRRGLMVVFAVLACLVDVVRYGSVGTAMVGLTVLTALLLGPFFAMDLLAVIFGLFSLEVATSMARLMVLSSSWLPLAIAGGVLAAAFLSAETWAALRGREYRDEEVRPQYAGHILERQSMQAELAAAREAQLHLLPKSAPEVEGLSISASCIPARIVGGDFYDFFALGEGRLGIFIAEGGNKGIGSAMNIALAKGFLMHTVRRNLSPREVLQRLESTVGPLLASAGATTYVAYAVIDTVAGTLRYARTGDYPRVTGTAIGAEQRVEIASSAPLYEGSANLRAGDTVLLFTDGIARRVRTTGPKAAESILKALARKRREHELEDDLTAVVIRVTRVGAAMEVVA